MQSNDSARLEMLVHRVRGPSLGWLPSIGFLQHPKKIRSGQSGKAESNGRRSKRWHRSGTAHRLVDGRMVVFDHEASHVTVLDDTRQPDAYSI
jgi:hypothetical protein